MSKVNGNDYEANEIETAGIITDDYGNKWTLPLDPELGEDIDFNYSPLDLPKKDPKFFYQFERTDRLAYIVSEGFVPVRRSEVGLAMLNDANKKLGDYGINTNTSDDPIHTVHDLTLVKIPIQFREMRLARAKREADLVKASIEPPKGDDKTRSRLRSAHEADGQRLVEDVETREEIVRPRHDNA
jgi:hypothetical protein